MSDRLETNLTDEEAKNRAARGVASVFGRHALVRALAFLGTLILTRMIAPESFGLFVAAQFVLSVLQALAVGGITSALVRRREAVEHADYRSALTLQQSLAVVVVVALFVVAPLISAAYSLSLESSLIFRVMSLAVFPLSLRAISLAKLQRSLRHDLTAACEVIEYAVYLAIAISLAVLGWDIWALVTATLARQVAGAVVMQWLARTLPRFGWENARVRTLLSVALQLQGQMLVELAQRSMIPVVVGFLFGFAAVGVTSLAVTVLEALVLQPLVMISSVQLRMFSRVQDSPDEISNLLENSWTSGAIIFLPPLIFFGLFAPAFMPLLLSPQWGEVGVMISWLAMASAIPIISAPTAQAAKALGELRTPLIAGLANLAVQVCILLATAPLLGLRAYPIAATVGAVVGAALVLRRVSRRLSRTPLIALVPIIVANSVTGAIWAAAVYLLSSWWTIALAAVGGMLVYVVLLVLFVPSRLARLLRFFGNIGPQGWRRGAKHVGAALGDYKGKFPWEGANRDV